MRQLKVFDTWSLQINLQSGQTGPGYSSRGTQPRPASGVTALLPRCPRFMAPPPSINIIRSTGPVVIEFYCSYINSYQLNWSQSQIGGERETWLLDTRNTFCSCRISGGFCDISGHSGHSLDTAGHSSGHFAIPGSGTIYWSLRSSSSPSPALSISLQHTKIFLKKFHTTSFLSLSLCGSCG